MEYKRLSELCRTTQGIQIPKSEQKETDEEGDIRYLYIADFKKEHEKLYVKNSYPDKIVNEDDLVMANTGSPGAVFKGKYGVLSNNLFRIEFDHHILHRDYLYYYLSSPSFQNRLREQMKGGIQKHLGHKTIGEQLIPIINKERQEMIVKALDQAQLLIDKRMQQIRECDLLLQAQFIRMFGDVLKNPFHWKVKKLGEIYEIIDGDRGNHYPKQEEFFEEGFCLFLNTGNVTSQGFHFARRVFITKEKDQLLGKGKLKRYDFVVTTRGTVGNIAYYDDRVAFDHIRINSGMVILRRKKDINPYYFIQYFRNPVVYQPLISGTAQPQMPVGNLKNVNIYCPPLELQNRFAEFAQQTGHQRVLFQEGLAILEENFHCLMQKAFSGTLFESLK